MAGMKEGPGEDPFAEDTTDDQADSAPDADPKTALESDSEPDHDTTDTMSTNDIPYVIRRQTVKEDRDNEHVAFLRDEYAELEDQIRADVADELDMRSKDVSVTDLREAFVELAAENPDAVAEILESWGYEHLR
jgi:flagellar biosynthesis/type III secretory pathway M-ring protein FliF/YscJ